MFPGLPWKLSLNNHAPVLSHAVPGCAMPDSSVLSAHVMLVNVGSGRGQDCSLWDQFIVTTCKPQHTLAQARTHGYAHLALT